MNMKQLLETIHEENENLSDYQQQKDTKKIIQSRRRWEELVEKFDEAKQDAR